MSDSFVPYSRQWVDEEDVRAVSEVLRGDYITTGPAVLRFEEALASATGADGVRALSSGTAALHAAYFALGLGPGDEVITSPLTFAATANAALYLGASVRFVDVREDTGNLDPELIASAISDRTRVITAVDYAGHPADYDAIHQVAEGRDIRILSDAAHSLGATYEGRRVGGLADLSVASFHPVKIITTAEGGAVLGSNQQLIQRVERFRDHGINRVNRDGGGSEGAWYYEMEELGFNYRLSDIHCALGLSQIQRLKHFVRRRREIAAAYSSSLSDVAGLVLPTVRSAVEPAWHLYVLRTVDAGRRRPFFDRLRELGLGVQVHYIPVYFHPYYRALGYERGLCPKAEAYYSRCLSIPIYPAMTEADVGLVVDRVHRAAAELL
jgi:UDP-4-amino-4,6-dideoxy-N-acetyl-beta-L-altrosamine transaminase